MDWIAPETSFRVADRVRIVRKNPPGRSFSSDLGSDCKPKMQLTIAEWERKTDAQKLREYRDPHRAVGGVFWEHLECYVCSARSKHARGPGRTASDLLAAWWGPFSPSFHFSPSHLFLSSSLRVVRCGYGWRGRRGRHLLREWRGSVPGEGVRRQT